MTAPATAHRESGMDGVVAMRIKDLERKLGEAQKKLNKMEANENGKAQNPPTLQKGADAGEGTPSKPGADRIKDPEFREQADMWIWEALLRQAEANLKQTEANLLQSDANQRQSEANLETARTLHLHTALVGPGKCSCS